MRAETRALWEREAAGRLTRDEAARLPALRREQAALGLRLRACAAAYARLHRCPEGAR
jgi:hypothetical protein